MSSEMYTLVGYCVILYIIHQVTTTINGEVISKRDMCQNIINVWCHDGSGGLYVILEITFIFDKQRIN